MATALRRPEAIEQIFYGKIERLIDMVLLTFDEEF